MRESKSESSINIQSVDRALNILEYLSRAKTPVSVQEISDAIGIKRTTAYGLLNTLIKTEYAVKSESGKYTVSGKMYSLSYSYPARIPIVRYVKKYMVELSEKFQETVHLGMLSIRNNIMLLKAQIPNNSFDVECGSFFPLYASGLGKVILAFLDSDRQKELIDGMGELKKYTGNTITEKETLISELERIREQGYAFDNEEYLEGTMCVAFPLFDDRNNIVAAMSVSGITENIRPKLEEIITNGLRCSKQCSKEMGWGAYNPWI